MTKNTFTLIHLFEILQRNWETRADVLSVEIRLEDMVKVKGKAFAEVTIETNSELYYEEEWRKLLENYYPVSKIKTTNTSAEELREFFDKEMLLFFEEYKPKFIYNKIDIPIHKLLNKNIPLEFGINTYRDN